MPEVYSCSSKDITSIKDTFVENGHFLLEVVRTDGRVFVLESRRFHLCPCTSRACPGSSFPPAPPGRARPTECVLASWGSWKKSCHSCAPRSSSSWDAPQTPVWGPGGRKRLEATCGASWPGDKAECPDPASPGAQEPGPSSSFCRLRLAFQGHPGRAGRQRMGISPPNANSWSGRGLRLQETLSDVICN